MSRPASSLSRAQAARFNRRLAAARAALDGDDNGLVAYMLGIPRSEIDRIAPPGTKSLTVAPPPRS